MHIREKGILCQREKVIKEVTDKISMTATSRDHTARAITAKDPTAKAATSRVHMARMDTSKAATARQGREAISRMARAEVSSRAVIAKAVTSREILEVISRVPIIAITSSLLTEAENRPRKKERRNGECCLWWNCWCF